MNNAWKLEDTRESVRRYFEDLLGAEKKANDCWFMAKENGFRASEVAKAMKADVQVLELQAKHLRAMAYAVQHGGEMEYQQAMDDYRAEREEK